MMLHCDSFVLLNEAVINSTHTAGDYKVAKGLENIFIIIPYYIYTHIVYGAGRPFYLYNKASWISRQH